VRIGNGRSAQRQIDVYGELMDSVYLFNKEQPISYDLWTALSSGWTGWRRTGGARRGVWEIRAPASGSPTRR